PPRSPFSLLAALPISLAVCIARFVGGFRFLAGPLAGAVGLPFRSFLRGNLLGAVLFVPYAVGIGYAIGYGLGPYIAHVRHALGGDRKSTRLNSSHEWI